MLYNYECQDCKDQAAKKLGRDLLLIEYEELVLFETSHSMNPTKKELKEATICPRCNGRNTVRSYHGNNIGGYVKGNGYLDKLGAKRDMTICKLTEDDPYEEYREPGEADHIKSQLLKTGRHNPKTVYGIPDTDTVAKIRSMEDAVIQATIDKPSQE